MANPLGTAAGKATLEIGKRLIKHMVRKSGSRVVGHLLKDSRVWKKAFGHISLHFSKKVGAGKATHAVFEAKYCSEKALKELVRKAANSPSRAPVVSKATIAGLPEGRPVVIIEREFREAIGQDASGSAAKILRLVVDYTGRPLTAFPVKQFLGAAGVASGALVLGAVQNAYASEAAANERRTEALCAPQHIVEWAVDLLVGSSCIAPDPPDRAWVEGRVGAALRRVEHEAGLRLDDQTREAIRQDILRLWGW